MKVYVVQWVRGLFDVYMANIDTDARTIYGLSLPSRIVRAFGQRSCAERFRLECEASRNPPVIVSNPFSWPMGMTCPISRHSPTKS